MEELLSSERIGAITIGDESKVSGKFFQMLESHTHSHAAGTDAAVIRYLIADHSPGYHIDDQPDVAFDAADFDVSLISNKGGSLLVGVCVDKGLDADGGRFAVVGNHLMGYGDAVDVHLEEIYRELTVDVMQLILVLAVILVQICLVNFLKVVKVVRAFGIHAFMDDEVLPVFLTNQRMGAVRALEGKSLGETVLIW